ncbi:MAG: IPT/TIG domain-containing protein [Bryobacteraceae bacterium]
MTRLIFVILPVFFLFAVHPPAISAQTAPQLTVVSAASRLPEVAPGSLVFIEGKGFTGDAVSIEQWQTSSPPTVLAGLSVLVGELPARIIYVTPEEIYCVLPDGLQPGEVPVKVVRNGNELVASGRAVLVSAAPGLFSEDNSGRGPGRIYDAATGAPGPFRVHTNTPGGMRPTRLLMAATGLRQALAAGQTITVAFMALGKDTSIREWPMRPVFVEPAPDYAGLDHVTVELPEELNALDNAWDEVFVAVRAADRQSNTVSLKVLMEEPPSLLSFEPKEVSPGQVLRISGQGFAMSVDGRDRVLLSAGNQLRALAIPFRTSTVGTGTSARQVLEIFTPPLAESPQAAWYAGPVQVCVATDGVPACAAETLRMVQPPPPATPPGDVLLSRLEKTYDGLAQRASQFDPALAKNIQAAKERARADLRARIDAALAGTPERIEIRLPDGTRVETVFDLAAIQKLEALTAAAADVLDSTLTAEPTREERSAVDSGIEEEIRQAAWAYQDFERTSRNIARVQLGFAAGAMLSCLTSGISCPLAVSAANLAAPAFAAGALASIAGQTAILLWPNTLQQLRVTPSQIVLKPGEKSEFDVRGHFVSALDPAMGIAWAAKEMVSATVAGAFGSGASFVVKSALSPVLDWIVNRMVDLGFLDMVSLPSVSSRDVGLSWQTVNSTCIRGSSPSPGAAFFLGSWSVEAFRGMTAPEYCQFAPKEGSILTLPEARAPVGATIFVSGPTNCYPLPANAPAPIFNKIYQVLGPNPAGDRLIVGEVSSMAAFEFLKSTLPLPSFPNEMVCGAWTVAPGCTVEAYLPTQKERRGDYSDWAEPIRDPLGLLFPGNVIPLSRQGPGGPLGLRVKSMQGCRP